ncbi:TIGR02678 family protein [Rhodococcus sp. IEGM 1401]|uniref:TIGR02678 family protein n=1 Tax=unclassified Rhodococcus (in: high G+C Gram-positive bacteria) TaxID=192944 RepID=UPI0022B30489|nr:MULTISPECIES: TIGR02678 family protein [unclassified Rhodococcus (in: high G+C Gram-positive bacteria)]MCZ4560304.1 TIGR02678 family protein [Rhodococcus sp. IEGM 1401]MDI9920431.1 TIGR02678 family protein [Rhodococcus sp. IEGM 1372]MDV8032883.1 TIGR02678 family protein [Rhodococcus sp. IEGM 1414]
MRAREISTLALDSYQRAARVALSNHLVTTTYPDRIALPLLRRWATELREDLLELFGYRLEVTETTARLFPVIDALDDSQPARTPTDRIFDRRRYAYLALALAALGRAGNQITLSELADHVAAEASQVDGVELTTDRASDRDAFVDAIGWLATRGAIALADGDASGWANNPSAGEALYDIDRPVVVAMFRPPRAVQHLRSIRGLLAGSDAAIDPEESDAGQTDSGREADPKETLRAVRRALVEQPVVYVDDLDPDGRTALAASRTVADVELLTGLVAERRAEGVALIDTSGRLSDYRFPSTGTIAQVALLIAGEISDRVIDPDAPALATYPLPDGDALIEQLDGAIPDGGVFGDLAEFGFGSDATAFDDAVDKKQYPLIEDSWLVSVVDDLVERFGRTFAAQWQTDRDGLRLRAIAMLHRLRLVHSVSGGALVLPVIARYRDVMVSVRDRAPQDSLFATEQSPSTDQSSSTDASEVEA